jgi:hypothetical protein
MRKVLLKTVLVLLPVVMFIHQQSYAQCTPVPHPVTRLRYKMDLTLNQLGQRSLALSLSPSTHTSI